MARRPVRRRGRGLPRRGRLDPARDRAAARRHAARPRAVGAARGVPARPGRPVRAAAPRPAAPRRGGGHRRHPGDRAGGPAAAPGPARPDPRGPARAAGRVPSRRLDGAGRSPGGRRGAIRHERRPGPARRARPPGAAAALRHLLGPLRRPPGPRHAAPRAPGAVRRRPARRARRGRAVAAAGALRRRHARTIARRSPGRPPARSVGEALVYAPRLDDERLAALVRGARAALLPVLSDSAGLPAIEAIACGVPVVASTVGALPEIVGCRRDPRRAARLATARIGARDGVPRRPGPRDAGRGRPRAGRRRAADLGGRRPRDAGRLRRRGRSDAGRLNGATGRPASRRRS